MSTDPTLAKDVDSCCRLTGEFTLRSGQVAAEYFDKYLFEADPALLARVVAQMIPLVPEGTELLGGLELGGVPIATVLSARTGLPALFVRKQAKEYGTCKLAEGQDVSGRVVTLVEDVITTGVSSGEVGAVLAAGGAEWVGTGAVIDRSGGKSSLPSAPESLWKVNFPLWKPEECPLCAKGIPLVKPGSRPKKS